MSATDRYTLTMAAIFVTVAVAAVIVAHLAGAPIIAGTTWAAQATAV